MIYLPKVVFRPKNPENSDKKLAYQTERAGCFDLYCDEPDMVYLMPGQTKCFASGTYLEQQQESGISLNGDVSSAVLALKPRSGLAFKNSIILLGGEVDIDYLGLEIGIILHNLGQEALLVRPGDRIAQARWTLTLRAVGVDVKAEKRSGGFGSTSN